MTSENLEKKLLDKLRKEETEERQTVKSVDGAPPLYFQTEARQAEITTGKEIIDIDMNTGMIVEPGEGGLQVRTDNGTVNIKTEDKAFHIDSKETYHEEAIANLKAYLRSENTTPRFRAQAHQQLAIGYLLSEKEHSAKIEAKKAIKEDAKYFGGWRTKAVVEYGQGNKRQALKSINKAISLSPEDTQSRIWKGRILESQSKMDDALKVYKRALEYDLGNKVLEASINRCKEGKR